MASYIYKNSRLGDYRRDIGTLHEVDEQEIAEVALDRYCLQEVLLTAEQNSEAGRRSYRVDIGPEGSEVHPYLGTLDRHRLVLHLFSEDSTSFIRTELSRLAALLRDTGLVAPEPVPDRDGTLVVTLGGDGSPVIHCVLMRSTQPRPSELSLSGALSFA